MFSSLTSRITAALPLPFTLLATFAFAACSADSRGTVVPAATSDAGPTTTPPTTESDAGSIVSNETDSGNADGCSEEAKLVYALSLEGDIYSFAPANKKFTKLGALACGGANLVPISMAVDRKAVAWVNLRDKNGIAEDTLYKVDTKTLDCTPSKAKGSIGGMGFSLNVGTTDQETLFVVASSSLLDPPSLSHVDVATEKLITGPAIPPQVDLELTGTGDGKLYGFLIDTPLAVAEIDKKSAALSGRHNLPTVETPTGPMFAFSFWGGDFYIYTATDYAMSKTTTVTRYRPTDGSVDTAYMKNIGFHIVGAGVSTCAPTTPPK